MSPTAPAGISQPMRASQSTGSLGAPRDAKHRAQEECCRSGAGGCLGSPTLPGDGGAWLQGWLCGQQFSGLLEPPVNVYNTGTPKWVGE